MASSEALTDYERRRLDNIRRNDEMMASLLVRRKAADLAAAAPRRSPTSKKPKLPNPPSSPVVIRRSLRARGIPPGSAPDAESPSPVHGPPAPPPPRKRGLIGIHEAYLGTPPGDRKLMQTVLDMADTVPLSARKKLFAGETGGRVSMTLKPQNVKRFLPGRILSVVFFPFKDRRLIAAGDKHGHVGFWDADQTDGDEGEGSYLYAPHSAPISSIVIQPFDVTKIFTASYDGFIRLMDVENETFNVVYSSDDAIYSASQQPEDSHSLYFGEGSGSLSIWDERAGKLSSSWLLHDMRINTIDFNSRNSNLMATSSSDGTVCIWDLRRIKHKNSYQKPNKLNLIQHNKSVHSAFFSPDGGALATTCLDDHIRIFRGDKFNDTIMIPHDNRTGRWISTFRAIWGWDDAYLFVGNMKRVVDVISTTTRATVPLVSEYMTAIPSRLAVHPFQRGSLACSTAGGQVYLWTS